MLVNSALHKNIPKKDIKIFSAIWGIVNILPEYEKSRCEEAPSPIYRCHSICRAFKAYLGKGMLVVDGHYIVTNYERAGRKKWNSTVLNCSHTWLALPGGSIVDLYPVGVFNNPLLLVGNGDYKPFGSGMYAPDRAVTRKVMTPEMRQETVVITAFVREAMAWKKKQQTPNK